VRIYLAIFLATLSTIAVPVPEEAPLLAAGYAARLGHALLVGCIGAAWLAVLIGDALAYLLGRTLLARLLCTRFGQWVLPREQRAWSERFVAVHGARAIVIGRFLVGLRGFVYFALGAARYPFARFLAANAFAAAVEVGAVVGFGFAFGELRAQAGRGVDLLAVLVLAVALCGPVVARAFARTARRPEG
jgi:membrane protein DedA with SNARE-associated domain